MKIQISHETAYNIIKCINDRYDHHYTMYDVKRIHIDDGIMIVTTEDNRMYKILLKEL